MITRLEIENFYSVRERQVIDLTISGKVPIEDDPFPRFPPLHDGSPARAPRIVAFYGANASGKSNVLRAITFLAWFMRFSFQGNAGEQLPYKKFETGLTIHAPTRISVQFAGSEDPLSDGPTATCPYTYVLELSGRENGIDRILLESLHYHPAKARRPVMIFARDADGNVKAAPLVGLGREKKVLERILRPNAGLVPTLVQLNNPFAARLLRFARGITMNILETRFVENDNQLVQFYHNDPTLLAALNREISRFDVGLDQVRTEMINSQAVAWFFHVGLDGPLRWIFESHGTQAFLRVFPLLHDSLQTGGIAVLDEIDVAIHPGLLPEILRWFLDPDRNPHGAQLWMSCHAPSLMAELEKEEIWFCEKTLDGATQVHALAQIQGVRRDAAFAQNYLGGVYGGVPHIG